MHTKNYKAFAEAIKEEMSKVNGAQMKRTRSDAMSDNFDSGQRAGIEKMARRTAEIFRKDNERFNVDQFLAAAGIR